MSISTQTPVNSLSITTDKDTLKVYQKQLNFLLKGLKFCEPVPGNLLIRINDKLCKNAYTLLR